MGKIAFSPTDQRIEATGKIGRTGATGTVGASNRGIDFGVNVGIASAGITTDYGGGISVGIAGQSITLGREGGRMQFGIGGLEVKVEARNCVVVETKKIFGTIVAQRSYPDPGCKTPEKQENKSPELPFDPEKGLELKDGTDLVYVFIDSKVVTIVRQWSSNYDDTDSHELSYKFTVSQIPEIVPAYSGSGSMPFKATSKFEGSRNIIKNRPNSPSYYTQAVTVKNDNEWSLQQGDRLVFAPTQFPGVFYTTKLSLTTNIQRTCNINSEVRPTNECSSLNESVNPFIIYGPRTNCKAFLEYIKKKNTNTTTTSGTNYYNVVKQFFHPISYVIPVGKQKPPAPFLPTGNQPPMQNCCEEVLDELEDIKEAFGVDRLLKDKFPVSNSFMAPGVDPSSTTEAKDYYEITQCLFRMMAHGMIFEPEAVIKDSDAAKAGDQSLKIKYLNATGWAKAVSEMLFEVRDDGNVSTNMDLRNGFTVTQMMVAVADIVEKVDTLLDCLGVPVKHKVQIVTTAFNCLIQVGKGFGDNNEKQLDLNEDEATETLLPEFLKTRDNKLKTVEIHPRSQSIFEILRDIQKSLPSEG